MKKRRKKQQKEQDGDFVEVEIARKNHTHQGKPCPVGSVIRVSRERVGWLKMNGIIK